MDNLDAAARNTDVIKGYEIWVGDDYDKYMWGAGAGGFEKKSHTTDKYEGNSWDVQTLTDPLFRTMSTCYEGDPGRALREFEDRMKPRNLLYDASLFSKTRFGYLQAFIIESEEAFIPIANLKPTTNALKSFQVLASAILELRTATYDSFYDIIKDAFAKVRELMGFTCDDSCAAASGSVVSYCPDDESSDSSSGASGTSSSLSGASGTSSSSSGASGTSSSLSGTSGTSSSLSGASSSSSGASGSSSRASG